VLYNIIILLNSIYACEVTGTAGQEQGMQEVKTMTRGGQEHKGAGGGGSSNNKYVVIE
jgi:hypothetical protein